MHAFGRQAALQVPAVHAACSGGFKVENAWHSVGSVGSCSSQATVEQKQLQAAGAGKAHVQEAQKGAVAFAPDGLKMLVLCAGRLMIWDLQQGVICPVLMEVQDGVTLCSSLPHAPLPSFSPDGKWLAVALNSTHVGVYSTAVKRQGLSQQRHGSRGACNINGAIKTASKSTMRSHRQTTAVQGYLTTYCSSVISYEGEMKSIR
jgi:hypothetical protein